MGRSEAVIPAVQGEGVDKDPRMELDEEMGQKLRLRIEKQMSAQELVPFFKRSGVEFGKKNNNSHETSALLRS